MLLPLTAFVVLATVSSASAAVPIGIVLSPKDGTTFPSTVSGVSFEILLPSGSSSASIYVKNAAGAASGGCTATYYSGQGWECNATGALAPGSYTWLYTFTYQGASQSSPPHTFSIAAPVVTTPTVPAATTSTAKTKAGTAPQVETLLLGHSVTHAGARFTIQRSVCHKTGGRFRCVARAANATRLFTVLVTTSPKTVRWAGWA